MLWHVLMLTLREVTTTALTLASKAVNTAAVTVLDKAVAIGKAVQFSVSGQVAGTTYRIRVTATTDSTPSRVKVIDVLLTCVPTLT